MPIPSKVFAQRFLFGQPEVSNGADTGKGFAQRFLFGQPEASNGADTGKGFSQRFLFGQPEADNGANTGKECTLLCLTLFQPFSPQGFPQKMNRHPLSRKVHGLVHSRQGHLNHRRAHLTEADSPTFPHLLEAHRGNSGQSLMAVQVNGIEIYIPYSHSDSAPTSNG